MSKIIKFEQSDVQNIDKTLSRVVGFVKLRNLADIIRLDDLQSNPRMAAVGEVTSAILESMEQTPKTFAAKTNGITLAAFRTESLDRGRYKLTFDNLMQEGIINGGHNALAVGLKLLQVAGADEDTLHRITRWSEFKYEFVTTFDEAIKETVATGTDPVLDILMPVEIITQADPDDVISNDQFTELMIDIIAARNNNVQLASATKANHKGYFDFFKKNLPELVVGNIEWKPGDGGRTNPRDLVALSWIPLSVLDLAEEGITVSSPSAASLYSSKGDCLTRFQKVMDSEGVMDRSDDGKSWGIVSPSVASAMKIACGLPEIYDTMSYLFAGAFEYNSKDDYRKILKSRKGKTGEHVRAKFMQSHIGYEVPEGYLMPLMSALTELMVLEDDGTVVWRTNPLVFVTSAMGEIVGTYKSVMSLLKYDPAKIGRAPEAYKLARLAVQKAFYSM